MPLDQKPTRTQKRIITALEKRGWVVDTIEWEPIGPMMEMQGHEGGWWVQAYPADESIIDDAGIAGYNVEEVLDFIEKYVRDYSTQEAAV